MKKTFHKKNSIWLSLILTILTLNAAAGSAQTSSSQETSSDSATKEKAISATEADQQQITVKDVGFNSTSKVILNQEAIRKSRAPNITTLLAQTANVAISNSAVQPGSIYLRGGDSGHILILVDGLPFYDPSTVQRTVNLNELDVRSIRRIEVIKGSQSVVYGGQALTGVIKIETLPLETESRVDAQLEAGTRQYSKAGAHLIRELGTENAVILKGASVGKDNRSPVLESSETYWSQLSTGEAAYVHRGEAFDAFAKIAQIYDVNALTESNSSTYRAVDSDSYHSYVDIKNLTLGFRGKKIPFRPSVTAGVQNARREFVIPSSVDQDYGSQALLTRMDATVVERQDYQVQTGYSSANEKFVYRDQGNESVNAQQFTQGLFIKGLYNASENLTLEAGIRSEFYQTQVSKETYQIGLTLLKGLKLEYATGFKAPSLFQKYSSYGNQELKPELAETWTLSGEISSGEKFNLSLTLFETTFKDLITTQGSYPNLRYYNISKAVTHGAELQSTFRFRPIRIDLGVGYQEPWDVNGARWLLRRPLRTESVRLTADLSDSLNTGFEVLHVGERLDRVSTTRYEGLDAYTVVNGFLSQQLNSNFSTYLRLQNIFNQRYEESVGYHNEGFFALVGIEFKN